MIKNKRHYLPQRDRCGPLLSFSAILLIHLAVQASAYTPATLQRLAQASSLSYLSLDKMTSSPYYEESQLQPILQVIDPISESGATIFSDSSNNRRLVVACRGSANPKNFGTNLKFNLVPATRLSQTTIPENAMVHEGFQDASVGLWRRLGPHLLDVLKKDRSSGVYSDLVFTGHSLGAATALLCAVHYSATIRKNDDDASSMTADNYFAPTVITFGGPKLCNGVLARHVRNNSLEGSNILHLVHDKDPVLANNQKLWNKLGFENVGVEMQCDPKSPIVYTDDNNQPKRRSSFFGRFAWNIVDHCNYMGVFVGPRI
jgi:hypothetical protein